MREILFRGKRKDNEKWIECRLLNFFENTYIIPYISECYKKLSFDNVISFNVGEVIPEIVGQYMA